MTLPPPPRPSRLRLEGHEEPIPVIAFLSAGCKSSAWKNSTGPMPLSNFWPLRERLRLSHHRVSASFQSAEAAHQSLKWWHHGPTRRAFEACKACGPGHCELCELIRKCEHDPSLEIWRSDFDGLGEFDAMLAVLRIKWRMEGLRFFLLSTGRSFLVDQCRTKDNISRCGSSRVGGARNRLGAALMVVREELLLEMEGPNAMTSVTWPLGVPRPHWAGGHGGSPDSENRWSVAVTDVVRHFDIHVTSGCSTVATCPGAASRACFAAWGLLISAFTTAFCQGPRFANDKESALLWGSVIGLASFFAWLAIENDDGRRCGPLQGPRTSLIGT
ncbi:hypothetical protein AB1Y20_022987 [Prymnesium parvum]|uniref:Uncharacterized protein n=1 Tax=Prymnesium parvum TaxID=97485 RepID=A0AB34JE29_PRYPA